MIKTNKNFYFYGVMGGFLFVLIVIGGNWGIGKYKAGADVFGITNKESKLEPKIGTGEFTEIPSQDEKRGEIEDFLENNWQEIAKRATNIGTWKSYVVRSISDDQGVIRVWDSNKYEDISFRYGVLDDGEVGFQIID